jgi:CII-binding regulator of phage lambda lysogenization HflD
MSELSRRLELSLAGVSQSVKRGEKIADEGGFSQNVKLPALKSGASRYGKYLFQTDSLDPA